VSEAREEEKEAPIKKPRGRVVEKSLMRFSFSFFRRDISSSFNSRRLVTARQARNENIAN
jgi:hypothetical protein